MPPTSPNIILSAEAYALPILHAGQHPSSIVLGLLVSSSSSSAPTSSSTLITSVIPLLHVQTLYTPLAEAALELARAYVASSSASPGAEGARTRIVGVYEVREADGSAGLGRAGKGLLKALMDVEGGAATATATAGGTGVKGAEMIALGLDEDKLGKGENPYLVYTGADTSKPAPASALSLAAADIPSKALALVRDTAARGSCKVYDFDDHMQDASKDWLRNESAKRTVAKRVGQ